MSDTQRERFYRSLPTERMASGCVLRNAAGEILVVQPTYKDYWELPGGVVEDEESLWAACRREVSEELSIELEAGSLLCVDYCSTQPGYVESLQVLFDGDVLAPEVIDQVQVDQRELSEARWVPIEEAERLVGDRVARRLAAVAPLLGSGKADYLEDQVPI